MTPVDNYALRGRRTLRVVQERRCEVCDDEGLLELVMALGIPTRVHTPCPHCSGPRIPIRPFPARDATTRRA